MATATATDPFFGTIGATPVVFFPVPTPWPMSARCDKYMHRQLSKGSILAWDPAIIRVGGSAGVDNGASCYPTPQQAWFMQDPRATPSTALGPTFVCPESYNAVFSTMLKSNSASRTDFTYCCPPKYTLNSLPPPNQRSAVQCTSILPVGSTIPFVSVIWTTTVISPTSTDTILAYIPSSTVVTAVPETVFGAPINGYNIVAAAAQRPSDTASGSPGGSTPTLTPKPTTAGGSGGGFATVVNIPPKETQREPSTGTPPGTIAGAVIGALVALALGIALAYFIGKWLRRKAGAGTPPRPELGAYGLKPELGAYGPKPELDVYGPKPELVAYGPKPELGAYGPMPELNTHGPVPELNTYGPVPELNTYGPVPELNTYGPVPELNTYGPVPELNGYGPSPEYVVTPPPGYGYAAHDVPSQNRFDVYVGEAPQEGGHWGQGPGGGYHRPPEQGGM